jgi:hypothetical protein
VLVLHVAAVSPFEVRVRQIRARGERDTSRLLSAARVVMQDEGRTGETYRYRAFEIWSGPSLHHTKMKKHDVEEDITETRKEKK